MPRHPFHSLLLGLALAVFVVQSAGATSPWGWVQCIGCPSEHSISAIACADGEVAPCCDEAGEPNIDGRADRAGNATSGEESCRCVDVPIEQERLHSAHAQSRLFADLQALPLPFPLALTADPAPRAAPDANWSGGPPRLLLPRLRFTILII